MKPSNRSVAVLVSGGLDSVALLGILEKSYRKVHPIYIRQGLRWESTEIYWLKRFLAGLKQTPLPSGERCLDSLEILSVPVGDVYQKHWSLGHQQVPGSKTSDSAVYLPGRNMLLSLKAAVFCAQRGISTLAIGSLDHNPFPDATPAFFKQWSRALSSGLGAPINLIAPLRNLSKAQVIARASNVALHLSFSCLNPQGRKHCGRCNKCAERRLAFHKASVPDKTRYAQ